MSLTRGRSSIEGLLLDWSLDQPAEPSRLPVALLSRDQKAAELQRVQRRKAIDAAYEAELVLGLAADTPDRFDPPPGTPGARKRGWAPDPERPRAWPPWPRTCRLRMRLSARTSSTRSPGCSRPTATPGRSGGSAPPCTLCSSATRPTTACPAACASS